MSESTRVKKSQLCGKCACEKGRFRGDVQWKMCAENCCRYPECESAPLKPKHVVGLCARGHARGTRGTYGRCWCNVRPVSSRCDCRKWACDKGRFQGRCAVENVCKELVGLPRVRTSSSEAETCGRAVHASTPAVLKVACVSVLERTPFDRQRVASVWRVCVRARSLGGMCSGRSLEGSSREHTPR